MTKSLSRLLVHVVYSTKERRQYLYDDIRGRLIAYQAGVYRRLECPAIKIGGVDDHLHALFVLNKKRTLAEVVEVVKKQSSKWMKTESNAHKFSWQIGYAAFSVSESKAPSVIDYIERQRAHHRRMSFEEELTALFERHGMELDQQHLG